MVLVLEALIVWVLLLLPPPIFWRHCYGLLPATHLMTCVSKALIMCVLSLLPSPSSHLLSLSPTLSWKEAPLQVKSLLLFKTPNNVWFSHTLNHLLSHTLHALRSDCDLQTLPPNKLYFIVGSHQFFLKQWCVPRICIQQSRGQFLFEMLSESSPLHMAKPQACTESSGREKQIFIWSLLGVRYALRSFPPSRL